MEIAGETRTIALGFVLAGAGTVLLLLLASELALMLVGAFVIAVGMGLLMPGINTAISNRTDAEHHGVTMGMLGSFNSAGRAAGPIAGAVAYSVSLLPPYALSAAISFVSALMMISWKAGTLKNAEGAAPLE
jgi:MFS transporter, DHA1 family, multidrug resistance protein